MHLAQNIVKVVEHPQISLASLTSLPQPLLLDLHSFALLMHIPETRTALEFS